MVRWFLRSACAVAAAPETRSGGAGVVVAEAAPTIRELGIGGFPIESDIDLHACGRKLQVAATATAGVAVNPALVEDRRAAFPEIPGR